MQARHLLAGGGAILVPLRGAASQVFLPLVEHVATGQGANGVIPDLPHQVVQRGRPPLLEQREGEASGLAEGIVGRTKKGHGWAP